MEGILASSDGLELAPREATAVAFALAADPELAKRFGGTSGALSQAGGALSLGRLGGIRDVIEEAVGISEEVGGAVTAVVTEYVAHESFRELPIFGGYSIDNGVGCAKVAWWRVGDLLNLVEMVAGAAVNPAEARREVQAALTDLVNAILADPVGVAEQFGKELYHDGLRRESEEQWVGAITCEILIEIVLAFLTAGTYTAARAGTFGPKIARILERLEDLMPDFGRPRPGPCPGNSFPTRTLVLLATGLVPIEDVRPGDIAVTYNTEAGVWGENLVLAQWSGLHPGAMATITLGDGSQVSSTDDHLFWVSSEGEWIEADRLRPGDLLLGPDGVAVVAEVQTAGEPPVRVWELDTADDDNFVVVSSIGTPLLVHNASPCRPPKDKDTLDGDPSYREGLSPRETEALERFLGMRVNMLNKWYGYDFDSLLPGSQAAGLRSRLSKSRNSIESDFDASDVAGRTKELRGEVTPADHVGSTERGIVSIENAVGAIDEALDSGTLDPDVALFLEDARRDLVAIKSEMIDSTVPRFP